MKGIQTVSINVFFGVEDCVLFGYYFGPEKWYFLVILEGGLLELANFFEVRRLGLCGKHAGEVNATSNPRNRRGLRA